MHLTMGILARRTNTPFKHSDLMCQSLGTRQRQAKSCDGLRTLHTTSYVSNNQHNDCGQQACQGPKKGKHKGRLGGQTRIRANPMPPSLHTSPVQGCLQPAANNAPSGTSTERAT